MLFYGVMLDVLILSEKLLIVLIMMELGFLREKKILARLKLKNNNCINVFCYENKLTFPICVSDQKFESSVDLLVVTDENKLHYVYITD